MVDKCFIRDSISANELPQEMPFSVLVSSKSWSNIAGFIFLKFFGKHGPGSSFYLNIFRFNISLSPVDELLAGGPSSTQSSWLIFLHSKLILDLKIGVELLYIYDQHSHIAWKISFCALFLLPSLSLEQHPELFSCWPSIDLGRI